MLLIGGHAQAQTIYRVEGPDGRITFSDRPQATTNQATTTSTGHSAMGASATGAAALPYALRQAVSKFPVTLYTTNNCSACDSGRGLLGQRGIPFAEKTVTTAEDAAALQRISGEVAMPFLTIGGQQIKGFSDSEWTLFLDAAGYPKVSLLPANYRSLPATPLVTLQAPTAPIANTENRPTQRTAPAIAPLQDAAANPAGIKF